MTIPKIIHQIWIQGYNQIPNELKNYHSQCKIINNDFEYIFWDETNIKKLLMENFNKQYLDLYNGYAILAQKADFARYAILYIYGGIYLDMDMVCRKNLSPFLNYQVFFTYSNAFSFLVKRYINCVIGTVPKHPLFLFIFKNMFARQSKKDDVIYSTGPKLFYASVIEYTKMTGKNDIMIVDRKYLNPCNPYDDDDCPYTCDDCYIAHTSYSSWCSPLHKFINKYVKLKYICILILLIIIFIVLINVSKS